MDLKCKICKGELTQASPAEQDFLSLWDMKAVFVCRACIVPEAGDCFPGIGFTRYAIGEIAGISGEIEELVLFPIGDGEYVEITTNENCDKTIISRCHFDLISREKGGSPIWFDNMSRIEKSPLIRDWNFSDQEKTIRQCQMLMTWS